MVPTFRFSGRTYDELAPIARASCGVAGRSPLALVAAVAVGPAWTVCAGATRYERVAVCGTVGWLCPVTARTVQGMALYPGQACCLALVPGQSASGGSLSTVAAGHFRRKREASLIVRGSTSQFRGHPRKRARPLVSFVPLPDSCGRISVR
jgi:hypothetical protein